MIIWQTVPLMWYFLRDMFCPLNWCLKCDRFLPRWREMLFSTLAVSWSQHLHLSFSSTLSDTSSWIFRIIIMIVKIITFLFLVIRWGALPGRDLPPHTSSPTSLLRFSRINGISKWSEWFSFQPDSPVHPHHRHRSDELLHALRFWGEGAFNDNDVLRIIAFFDEEKE